MIKKLTQKRSLLFALFLLMGALYTLHAAKSVYQPDIQLQNGDCMMLPSPKRKLLIHSYCRVYNIPTDICFVIRCLVYDNPFKYRNKTLPSDLSTQDLSGFYFTGCVFTYTNLSYTDLTNVILTNTTCDYQKAFLDNIKKNKLEGGNWYQENIPIDLKSIAAVYPKLNNNTHKARLLHIACGLSRLPFYEETEFYITVAYFSSALLQLKQALSNPYSHQLVCSLVSALNYDAGDCCWKTKYPQDKVDIAIQSPHANFTQYLKDFTSGLTQYQCRSIKSWGFDWYKDNITKNIEGLQKTYPNIRDKQLQRTACGIAQALSKSYQIQHLALLYHYLFYQHRLILLKRLVSIGGKNEVYYSEASTIEIVGNSWNSMA